MQGKIFTNARVITPIEQIERGFVWVEADTIRAVGSMGELTIPENVAVCDLQGAFLSPGFIDLHLHGAWGGDVMNATMDDLRLIAQGLVTNGVTAFLPTTLSGKMEKIAQVVDCVDQALDRNWNGAKILGVHLEGPYFSNAQKGAQNPEYIINPDPLDYMPLLEKYACIKRVSAAPELPGALELGRELRKRKIVASIAHSDASYQQILKAIQAGYTHATHMYSGMSTIHRIEAYRVAGVIEAVLLQDELTTELIGDGHHLPPSLMKLVLKTKGLDRVCLVTDAMAAAGLGPGRYSLGGLDVIIEAEIPDEFEIATESRNYVAKLVDKSAFASSVTTMDRMVWNIVKYVGLSIADAIRLVTWNPARMQGLASERGLIAPGLKADLTVFDSEINILMTMVEGQIVYRSTTFEAE